MWLSNTVKISNKLISFEGLIIIKRDSEQKRKEKSRKKEKRKKMRLSEAFSVIKNNWCKWQKQAKR